MNLELTPAGPPRRTVADIAQGTMLRAITSLPRGLARRLAPDAIPENEVRLDRRALALAAMSARTGIRLVVDGSADASRTALRAGSGALVGKPLAVEAHDTTIQAHGGSVRARLYTPKDPGRGLLVFAHGGGWAIGDLDTYDYSVRFLAHHAGVRVLAVDYALAPENPFPSGLNDLTAAFRWAVANARGLGVDPHRIGIGGDSAGATLSAAASADLVDDDVPPAMQMLLFPATDLAERSLSRNRYGSGLLLTEPDIEWFYNAYAGPTDRTDPRLSPRYAVPTSRLPPTYLATAGYDPLRDEGDAYASSLAAAGVPVTHVRHDDLVHGYLSFVGLGGAFARASRHAALAVAVAIR